MHKKRIEPSERNRFFPSIPYFFRAFGNHISPGLNLQQTPALLSLRKIFDLLTLPIHYYDKRLVIYHLSYIINSFNLE
ncbi:MAG: hypothetical protein AVO38_01280 [delta proteobacterium ML8_D]|nr:MAG: hypothetical protein AVO38_01280 [delta proteobacterium ML8_D]